jgi:hypothetical protein
MWTLGDGNELHVTVAAADGSVVYMESDWGGWNGDKGAPETDFPNLLFGRTTRQEITSKFGSSGVVYENRWGFVVQPDKSATFNTIYDVSSTNNVIDFMTKIDQTTMRLRVRRMVRSKGRFEVGSLGDVGTLVTIIVATRSYVDDNWGKHVPEANYAPVALGSLQPRSHAEDLVEGPDAVPLVLRNGVRVVPAMINNRLILDFVVDSGAADVQIPDDVFRTLVRTGTILPGDFLGTEANCCSARAFCPSSAHGSWITRGMCSFSEGSDVR